MSDPITQAAIQARAYQLWEESGCVEGNHEEHWRRAEAECGTASDGAGMTDRMDRSTTLSSVDGSSHPLAMLSGVDDAALPLDGFDPAASPGIDEGISKPPVDTTAEPRRWPTSIVDA